MRFAVEPWAPEFGVSLEPEVAEPEASRPDVDPSVELEPSRWGPQPLKEEAPSSVLFVDGVRRVDARVWITQPDGLTRPGLFASYAAGAVRCGAQAEVVDARVERGLFTSSPAAEAVVTPLATYEPRLAAGERPEELAIAVQQRMRELEAEVAGGAAGAELCVLDGPLTGRQRIRGAVGYVKTHHTPYLGPELVRVVESLEPGERTPLFLVTTSWSRLSFYLRLPGRTAHPWAGVVRVELTADLAVEEARTLAGKAASVLCRFASHPHRDPRAPQNLYPIAGLERELRRRLGDEQILLRALKSAAGGF